MIIACSECCRRWKYDPTVEEYFVETVTKAVVKQSELTRIKESMERDLQDPHLQNMCPILDGVFLIDCPPHI